MVDRSSDVAVLRKLIEQFPVTGIIGARQVGKTTLARIVGDGLGWKVTHIDLEDPEDLERMKEPMMALRDLRGLIIIDEIQRTPEIFPVLRVLADRHEAHTRYLILGSASPDLLRQGSESLAGRIAFHELGGFTLPDLGIESLGQLWLRGGFPRSYLAKDDASSLLWRREYIQTFLERDIPQLGSSVPAATLRRFWNMIAHYHGQLWNAAELSRSFGLSDASVRRYLDLLTSALVLRQLSPWHENLGKRQIKSPKVYVADSGILHALLGIENAEDLHVRPQIGASWEGFFLDQIIRLVGLRWDECYFWRTTAGAELDLFFMHRGRRIGVEIKRTSTPKITPSMRSALQDLKLDELILLHAGQKSFPLAENIHAVAADRLLADFPISR
ncbi:MAG: ATP-binding protein [Bacteroidota bacterium]